MEKLCKFCGVLIEGYSRSTKKYCSDNCKQLAFYARQGKNWGKPAQEELHGVKPNFTLNTKQDETAKINRETIIQQSSEQTENAKSDVVTVKPYRWVNSPLVEAIENYRNQTNAENMFGAPEYSWTQNAITYVYWVTIRLRCLLDNLIRLSSFKAIDRNTVQTISKAFVDLTDSCYFKDVPRNYPFIGLVVQLRDKFNSMAKQLRGDEITLRLSLNRKAELMAARFAIGNFVPKMSFSQLNFSDDIKEQAAKMFRNDDRE